MEDSLKNTLKEFSELSKSYNEKLDKISNDIRFYEHLLTESPFKIDFGKEYENFYLEWAFWIDEKYRLTYRDKDICKPLIETKSEIRILAYDHLEDFFKSFMEFLKINNPNL